MTESSKAKWNVFEISLVFYKTTITRDMEDLSVLLWEKKTLGFKLRTCLKRAKPDKQVVEWILYLKKHSPYES